MLSAISMGFSITNILYLIYLQMTVKELIEKLQKMPQDKEVWIYRENGTFKSEYDATTLESVEENRVNDMENWGELKDVVILNAD